MPNPEETYRNIIDKKEIEEQKKRKEINKRINQNKKEHKEKLKKELQELNKNIRRK